MMWRCASHCTRSRRVNERAPEALLATARDVTGDLRSAGTDLVLNTAGRKAFGLWGAADQPGKWDHWSVAVVVGGASRPNSNGRLVIDVGDIILGMRRYATTRIDLIIEEGIITRIEGEGLDAHLLRNWFASWGDERAFHLSHVGWGCDERADWGRMAGPTGGIGDAESCPGVFQIAFGRDTSWYSWYIGDGTNDIVAHIDFNGLAHSIALDGVPVTENGRFVHPDWLTSRSIEGGGRFSFVRPFPDNAAVARASCRRCPSLRRCGPWPNNPLLP